MLSFRTQLLVRREIQMARPIDDLAIRIVRLLSTERWPSYQTLEHDRSHTPPIAAEIIALPAEDLRRDVVRRSHCRVRQLAAGLAPGVDLVAVGDGELDLVDADRVAVLLHRFRAALRHQLLVVGCGVFFGEAGRETKVGEFDVAAAVEQDIVGFDVTVEAVSGQCGKSVRLFSLTDE